MATPPERLASNADQACVACKRQKRRCDKAVPQCSLCRRTGRVCVYSDAADPPPTATAFAALQRRLSELEDRLNTPPNTFTGDTSSPAESHRTLSDVGGARNSGQSTVSPSLPMVSDQQELEFPAALFLDIDCFVWAGIQMPDPSVGIPTVRTCPECMWNGPPSFYFIKLGAVLDWLSGFANMLLSGMTLLNCAMVAVLPS
jgi:hypothetical protein